MSASDRRSEKAAEYRKLYKTAKWRSIAAAQLSKQRLCERCLKVGKYTVATICHHVNKDTKDSPDTFFVGPFASVCKRCHDGPMQREERSGAVEAQFDASGRVVW